MAVGLLCFPVGPRRYLFVPAVIKIPDVGTDSSTGRAAGRGLARGAVEIVNSPKTCQ